MGSVYQNISNFLFVRYVGPMQRSIGFHVPSELAGSQPSIAAAAFCNPASVMMPSAGVRAVLFILSFQNGRAMVEGRNTRQQSSFRRLWRRRSRAASGCRSTRRPVPGEPVAATSQRHGRRNCGAGASYSVQSQAVGDDHHADG